MMPEEEQQQFWLALMERIHTCLAQLDPPRSLVFLTVRRRAHGEAQRLASKQRKPKTER